MPQTGEYRQLQLKDLKHFPLAVLMALKIYMGGKSLDDLAFTSAALEASINEAKDPRLAGEIYRYDAMTQSQQMVLVKDLRDRALQRFFNAALCDFNVCAAQFLLGRLILIHPDKGEKQDRLQALFSRLQAGADRLNEPLTRDDLKALHSAAHRPADSQVGVGLTCLPTPDLSDNPILVAWLRFEAAVTALTTVDLAKSSVLGAHVATVSGGDCEDFRRAVERGGLCYGQGSGRAQGPVALVEEKFANYKASLAFLTKYYIHIDAALQKQIMFLLAALGYVQLEDQTQQSSRFLSADNAGLIYSCWQVMRLMAPESSDEIICFLAAMDVRLVDEEVVDVQMRLCRLAEGETPELKPGSLLSPC